MAQIKRKMMEVQEEAIDAAFEVISGGETPANPYVGTIWEKVWKDAFENEVNEFRRHIDDMAARYEAEARYEAGYPMDY